VTAAADAENLAIRRGGPELAAGGRFRPAPGHELLLRIVAGYADAAREALEHWCATFDPRLPVDGGTYRLLPLVFQRMREWDFDHPLRALVKGVYRRSLVENSFLVDGAAPALQAMADRGLEPTLLKGAALVGGGYYPTLATRPMQDVDVYLPPGAHDEATAILDSLGWRRVPRESGLLPFLHASTFQAPRDGATVDLHRHALVAVQTTTSDQALLADARPALGVDLAASVPDPTAQLIITLVHGSAPNAEPPVRWVADALLILARGGLDWDRVVDYARIQQVGVRIRRTLEVVDEFATDDLWPVIERLGCLPIWPLERLERRMMDRDHSSLMTRVSLSTVRASAGNRSASTPVLLTELLRHYHDTWQVPWGLVPLVATRKFRQHLSR
jgi:hypothetical protein